MKEYKLEQARLCWLMLLAGVVHITIYWLMGLSASVSGSMPMAQPDSLLYCQAARRIAEGAPFTFSLDTAVSTGTTSVLYPFLLAIPYALGAHGESLLTVGFWLNALFYLVFLWGWGSVISRWFQSSRERILAAILLVLSGHCAFCALSQSDIGLWLAVSGLMAAMLVSERWMFFSVLLAVSPWVRPEGLFCGLAFFLGIVFNRTERRRNFLVLVPFLASVIGVFALNYCLTGRCQFSSVAHKGYVNQVGLVCAIPKTLIDSLEMAKGLFLSLAQTPPREYHAIPLLGGILFLLGVIKHDWSKSCSRLHLIWVCACMLGFMSVAQSGWQGTNTDRYVVWIIPVVSLYMVEGLDHLACLLNCARAWAGLAVVTVLYAIATSVAFACTYYGVTSDSDRFRMFAEACERNVPERASIASMAECGAAYFMSPRRMANLSGIYSPEFSYMSLEERLDDLKRNPEKRFDYWILNDEFQSLRCSPVCSYVFGDQILVGPQGRALHKADWRAFDAAAVAPAAEPGERLVAWVDVGYPPDEKLYNYKVEDFYNRAPANPFPDCRRGTNGAMIVDVGRIIVGADEMRVPVVAGKPLRVVMRLSDSATALSSDGFVNERIRGATSGTVSMNIAVDGKIVQRVCLPCESGLFNDISFTLPGSAFAKSEAQIAFLGDHIPFSYWFYAKEDDK